MYLVRYLHSALSQPYHICIAHLANVSCNGLVNVTKQSQCKVVSCNTKQWKTSVNKTFAHRDQEWSLGERIPSCLQLLLFLLPYYSVL